MKNRILILLTYFILNITANAQADSLGIYLTANDYLAKKISYKVSCRDLKDQTLDKSVVSTIKHQAKHFEKSTWFGFHGCKTGDHRFYENQNYRILQFTSELVIYSNEVLHPKGKVVVTETEYSFSRGIEGKVLPLEIKKLKGAFPENKKFHDMLDELFDGDYALIHFNKIEKQYKLIDVYNQSKNDY